MTSEEHTVRELFRATDGGDLGRVLELLTDDVHFQFGNAEPAVGHDGSRLTLPCANVFRLRDGRIADYRIYMDINPVLAP